MTQDLISAINDLDQAVEVVDTTHRLARDAGRVSEQLNSRKFARALGDDLGADITWEGDLLPPEDQTQPVAHTLPGLDEFTRATWQLQQLLPALQQQFVALNAARNEAFENNTGAEKFATQLNKTIKDVDAFLLAIRAVQKTGADIISANADGTISENSLPKLAQNYRVAFFVCLEMSRAWETFRKEYNTHASRPQAPEALCAAPEIKKQIYNTLDLRNNTFAIDKLLHDTLPKCTESAQRSLNDALMMITERQVLLGMTWSNELFDPPSQKPVFSEGGTTDGSALPGGEFKQDAGEGDRADSARPLEITCSSKTVKREEREGELYFSTQDPLDEDTAWMFEVKTEEGETLQGDFQAISWDERNRWTKPQDVEKWINKLGISVDFEGNKIWKLIKGANKSVFATLDEVLGETRAERLVITSKIVTRKDNIVTGKRTVVFTIHRDSSQEEPEEGAESKKDTKSRSPTAPSQDSDLDTTLVVYPQKIGRATAKERYKDYRELSTRSLPNKEIEFVALTNTNETGLKAQYDVLVSFVRTDDKQAWLSGDAITSLEIGIVPTKRDGDAYSRFSLSQKVRRVVLSAVGVNHEERKVLLSVGKKFKSFEDFAQRIPNRKSDTPVHFYLRGKLYKGKDEYKDSKGNPVEATAAVKYEQITPAQLPEIEFDIKEITNQQRRGGIVVGAVQIPNVTDPASVKLSYSLESFFQQYPSMTDVMRVGMRVFQNGKWRNVTNNVRTNPPTVPVDYQLSPLPPEPTKERKVTFVLGDGVNNWWSLLGGDVEAVDVFFVVTLAQRDGAQITTDTCRVILYPESSLDALAQMR